MSIWEWMAVVGVMGVVAALAKWALPRNPPTIDETWEWAKRDGLVEDEPWSCPRCGVAWRNHPNQHTEDELCMRCDAIAVREGFCTAHYEIAAADGIPRKQKMHACCYRPIGESHADYCTEGVKEGWEGFGTAVMPQATINAPPLAPICYVCGCANTEEHAALPHNDYGVAWDRVPVRKSTCDTTNDVHYFNRRFDRCDCGGTGIGPNNAVD